MQRPCLRNLHQTIAASPVSSGYLWNSREAAERFYSEAWKSTIAQRYGAQPEISFYDTSVIVENVDQKASAVKTGRL